MFVFKRVQAGNRAAVPVIILLSAALAATIATAGCGGGNQEASSGQETGTAQEVQQEEEKEYQATTAEVEAFVKEALEYARSNEKDEVLAVFTDPSGDFVRGELYIYAYDFKGNVIAHGGDSGLVGQNLIDYTDPEGVRVIERLRELAREGEGWLEYTWNNPGTGRQEAKLGYVVKVDDSWFIGSGTYR